MTRGLKLYIDDIEDAIKSIEKYTKNISLNAFVNDRKTIDAVIRNLSVIGEAVRHISKEIKQKKS